MSKESVENLTRELKDILLKTKKNLKIKMILLKSKDHSRSDKKRISKFV